MSRGKVYTIKKSILYIVSPILTSITVFPKMSMRVPLAEIKYRGPFFNVSMLLTNLFLITLVALPVSTRARTGVLLVLSFTFIKGILILWFSLDGLAGTPRGELDSGAPISLKGCLERPDPYPECLYLCGAAAFREKASCWSFLIAGKADLQRATSKVATTDAWCLESGPFGAT
jgi:hypothetical protein